MTRSLVLRALTLSVLLGAGVGCNERRHATRRIRARNVQPTALAASAPAAAPAGAASGRPPAATVSATAPAASPPAPVAPAQTSGAKALPAPTEPIAAARQSPTGAAGAAGAATPEMAVVILMLPGAGDPAHPGTGSNRANSGPPLTYKVSLAPGGQNATIELEGRPPVIAPVQRIFPSPPVSPSSLALLRSLPAAPASKAPARATASPTTGGPGYPPPSARARTLAPPSPLPPSNFPADDATVLAEPRGSRISRRAIPTSTRPPLSPPEIEFTSANGAPIIE